MALLDKKVQKVLDAQLTLAERSKGVVYVLAEPVAAGTTLDFPHAPIHLKWEATVAFIDRDPTANWGHSCRYLLISHPRGEVVSIEARFPPFRRDDGRHWRVAFQAASVSDVFLAVPK